MIIAINVQMSFWLDMPAAIQPLRMQRCNLAFPQFGTTCCDQQRVIGRAHTTEAILRKCLEFELPKENEVTR